MNKLILMGRLTGEPEMKTVPGENANIVANFSLAVDRMGKQRDGQPTADFFKLCTSDRTFSVRSGAKSKA